jgi:hypothetical protein
VDINVISVNNKNETEMNKIKKQFKSAFYEFLIKVLVLRLSCGSVCQILDITEHISMYVCACVCACAC